MTIQSKCLLRKLKKAQKTEDGEIYIDFEDMTVVTVHTEGSDFTTVKLKRYKDSIHSILSYLKELGYIDFDDFGQAKVLHSGWNWGQMQFSRFISFLFTSILVPIFVSVVTSIIVTVIALIFQTIP